MSWLGWVARAAFGLSSSQGKGHLKQGRSLRWPIVHLHSCPQAARLFVQEPLAGSGLGLSAFTDMLNAELLPALLEWLRVCGGRGYAKDSAVRTKTFGVYVWKSDNSFCSVCFRCYCGLSQRLHMHGKHDWLKKQADLIFGLKMIYLTWFTLKWTVPLKEVVCVGWQTCDTWRIPNHSWPWNDLLQHGMSAAKPEGSASLQSRDISQAFPD